MKSNKNLGKIQNLDLRLKAMAFTRAKLESSRTEAEEICQILGLSFTDYNIAEITRTIDRIEKRLRTELKQLGKGGSLDENT